MFDLLAEFYLRRYRQKFKCGTRACLHTPLGFFRGRIWWVGIKWVLFKLDLNGQKIHILVVLLVPENNRLAAWLIRRKIKKIYLRKE